MRETLTEIDNAEQERRERARRYEHIVNEVETLRRSIAHLESVSVDASKLKALEKIHELSADIPPGLITKGSRFIPGGFIARDIVMTVAGDALADLTRKQQATATALQTAQQRLIDAQRRLVDAEQEN